MTRPRNRKEPVQVEITGLHADGYGLTDDPRLCVIGSLPGEIVTVLPFTTKKRKVFAKVIELHQASSDRVEPPCQAADICGGCSLQHLNVEKQVAFKQQQLVEALGDTQPMKYYAPLVGPVGNYRAKARLGVRFVEKKNRVLVGFREKMKPFIADFSRCHTLRHPVATLLPQLAELISKLSNCRCVPQIEVAVGDSSTALVFRHLEELTEADLELFRKFSAQNSGEHEISVYLQPGNAESVYKLFPADNNELISYSLPEFDLLFSFHPLDFTQINHAINRKMVSFAVELLLLDPLDRVFDGFCGIGNFSLALARKSALVTGVESSETSVERARENAQQNGISNCVFITENLFAEDIDIPGLKEATKVILDPPRSGALEVCKRLATHDAERVVYVSCNPVTLARDAAVLVANGFGFEGAGVIDMFPHTTHVESIACFSQ
jgi:23S rRNA (uracil1939-C5)-methyltransferase